MAHHVQLPSNLKTATILPAEIWIHVAQFIPNSDLRSMLGISRVFFQLAMDARYHELTFVPDSELDIQTLRKLQRVRDPSISHRVHSLHIDLMYHGYGVALYESNEEGDPELGTNWTILEVIQIMTETTAYLTNVTEFTLYLSDCPREHIVPFFIVAWQSFGSILRKLAFSILLEHLEPLLSTMHALFALRHLDAEIRQPYISEKNDEVLTRVLAPFVNKIAPTLHTLSLCISGIDVTPLFHNLERVPDLKQLCIRVDHSETLMETFGVTRFICNHASTLRHLDWDQLYQPPGERYFKDLLHATKLEEVFLNLRTLRIRVPGSSDGVAVVARLTRFSAQTLTSLVLWDYDMTYEEVHIVISVFTPHSGGNLKVLKIRVQFLSPELILLLAETLPFLEKLTIDMEYIAGHEAGKRTSEAIDADSNETRAREESVNASIFASTVRTYNISGWPLRDINIRGAPFDVYLPDKLMRLLAECIPSVQKFNEQDKELYLAWRGCTDDHL